MLEPAVLQMQMEKTSSCETLASGEVHTVSGLGKLVLGQEGGSALLAWESHVLVSHPFSIGPGFEAGAQLRQWVQSPCRCAIRTTEAGV